MHVAGEVSYDSGAAYNDAFKRRFDGPAARYWRPAARTCADRGAGTCGSTPCSAGRPHRAARKKSGAMPTRARTVQRNIDKQNPTC